MGGKHAKLSPSNKRWPYCPGSVREEAVYPDIPGEAAVDGTGTHLLVELCVTGIKRAEEFIGQTIGVGHEDKPGGWLIEKDRCDRANMLLDYLVRRRAEIKGRVDIMSESSSNPGLYFGRNDWEGTCDITLYASDLLEVIDYKDGREYVSEKNNSQNVGYATGKLGTQMKMENVTSVADSRIKRIRMTIIQPKTNIPIRYEEISALELWERATDLARRAKLTDDPNAPLIEGPHCHWCKHGRAGNCSEKNQKAMGGIAVMNITGDLPQTAPSEWTEEQLVKVLDAAALIRKTLDDAEAEGLARVTSGLPVGNYVKGKGRGSKEFVDPEDVVVKKLTGMRFKKADIFPSKLITPAQALAHESLTDRQRSRLMEMIKEVDGKDKLVKDTSKTKQSAQDMFEAVAGAVRGALDFSGALTPKPAPGPMSFM